MKILLEVVILYVCIAGVGPGGTTKDSVTSRDREFVLESGEHQRVIRVTEECGGA